MADCDEGETFLNFILESSLRPNVGVDLSSMFLDQKDGDLKGQWERMNMAFRASSYLVTKEMSIVEESVTGAHLDPNNVF